MLTGYKTYTIAVLIGVLAVAKFLGWVSPDLATAVVTLLTAGGLGSLRAAVAAPKS